jgi:transposase-like protein
MNSGPHLKEEKQRKLADDLGASEVGGSSKRMETEATTKNKNKSTGRAHTIFGSQKWAGHLEVQELLGIR